MEDILDNKILPLFKIELNNLCYLYTTIGMNSAESPKWLQYKGYCSVRKVLEFRSSQRHIGFEITVEHLSKDELRIIKSRFSNVYDYFREHKYEHIKKEFPTITEGGLR